MKRVLVVLGLTLVVAGVLIGCGSPNKGPSVASANGGTGKSTATPHPTASVDRQQQALNFARCMRAHGVDVPDPDPNGGGGIRINAGKGTRAKVEAAQQACKQYLPNGGEPPSLSPQEMEQLRKFAKCMRDHGINVADPDPANPGIRINGAGPGDPKFKAAQDACQSLMPGGPGGPGPKTDEANG
jgi:hypothetical protein